jgi:hypothetical protein
LDRLAEAGHLHEIDFKDAVLNRLVAGKRAGAEGASKNANFSDKLL